MLAPSQCYEKEFESGGNSNEVIRSDASGCYLMTCSRRRLLPWVADPYCFNVRRGSHFSQQRRPCSESRSR